MADEELERMLSEAERAEKATLIEGYRTVDIEFEIGEGDHTIFVDGITHSTLVEGETMFDPYTGCLSSYSNETIFK